MKKYFKKTWKNKIFAMFVLALAVLDFICCTTPNGKPDATGFIFLAPLYLVYFFAWEDLTNVIAPKNNK